MDTPSRNASSPSSTAGSSPSLGGSSSSLMASAPAPAHPHFLFAPPPPHQSCTDDEAAGGTVPSPSPSTPPPLASSSASNRRIEWTRSNILSFIEDYRQQRNLWDSASTGYHVKQTKFEALKALSTKYSTDIRTIRSKIKSLRSSFHREHGKVKNCRMRGLHYQPMWFAYDAIRFILPPGEDVKPLMGAQACGGGVAAVGGLDAACMGEFKLKEEVMEAAEEGDEDLNDGFDDICEQRLGKEDAEEAGDDAARDEMADGNNNNKSMHTYEPSFSDGGKKGQRKAAKEAASKKAAATTTNNNNANSSGTDSTVSSTTTSPLPMVALKHELFGGGGGSGGGASNTSTRLASLNGSSSSLMATVDALHEKAAAAAAAAALAEAETSNLQMTATSSPAAANSLSEVINYLALTRSRTNILAPILTCNNFSVYSNHHNNNSQHHNNNQQHRNNNSTSSSISTNLFNNGGYTNEDSNQTHHNNNNNGGLDMSLANGGAVGGGGSSHSNPAANTAEQFVQRINAFVTAAAAASIVAANCQSNNNNNTASFFNGIGGSSRPEDSDGPLPHIEYHDPNQFQGVTEEIVETQLVEAPGVTHLAGDMSSSMNGGEPGNTTTFEKPSTSSAAAAANSHGSRKRKQVKTEAVSPDRALNGSGGAVTSRSLGMLNTNNGGGGGGVETLLNLGLVAPNNGPRAGGDVSKMRRFAAPGNPNSTAETADAGELLVPPPPQAPRHYDSAEDSENDECLVFGEYVGRVIRKLSMRAEVKNIICNALYTAEKREEEMRQQMEREATVKDTSRAGGVHPSVASWPPSNRSRM